jgi:hypothetical protein
VFRIAGVEPLGECDTVAHSLQALVATYRLVANLALANGRSVTLLVPYSPNSGRVCARDSFGHSSLNSRVSIRIRYAVEA